MTILLTFGMSVAVLVHIAIVRVFNVQVVQRQRLPATVLSWNGACQALLVHGTTHA